MSPEEWEQFRAGDEWTFRCLVERYSPRLLAVVHGWLQDRDEAEDILQEAWLRIHTNRLKCTERGAFLGWSMAICRNLCMDRIRSERSRKERQTAYFGGSHGDGGGVSSRESAPINDEISDDLMQELLALPDLQRDVVILRFVEGLSTREAAERLGCAVGTVKASLHRAVSKLKESLTEWRS